jgi:methionyl aminopeptidase
MTIESDDDLTALAAVGRIIRETLAEMARRLHTGMTTAEFDAIGGAMLEARGVRSAPRLAYNFPGHTCISVNDEAAHGIPGDRVLCDGDLVNIDVSVERDGYWVDTGGSFPVGPPSKAVAELCAHTRAALRKAVFAAKAGRLINAIAKAVEGEARRGGYNIVDGPAGHGVGRFIHEAPTVANIYSSADRQHLHEGLVIAIEPFLTKGSGVIVEADDGWTLKTADGSLAAQYEHSVVITKGNPIILT